MKLLEVETERVETQIISYHLMSKVVTSEIKDTQGLRLKEQQHD